ncbi:hypothetical protein B0H10DRAFT_1648090, partial [Mycena sp. CBHHK59/15]
KSVVVRTSGAWRRQVAEWQAEIHELDAVSDNHSAENDDNDLPSSIPVPPRSWFPTTLASLFGGVIKNPITLARHKRVVSKESLYMELLAAEHSDEEPDTGAQEGSGDDYD